MKKLSSIQEDNVKYLISFIYNEFLSGISYDSFEDFYNDFCENGDDLFDYLDSQDFSCEDDVHSEVSDLLKEFFESIATK